MAATLSFLKANFEQFIVTVIIMAVVVLMLWNFRRRRCPKCGKRTVRLQQGCTCCRLETTCEGGYVCDNCQANFASLKELRKAVG